MKRTRLTNEQKLKIIDDVNAEVMNKKQAMEKYNINRRTICKILKNEKSLREIASSFEMKERKSNRNPQDKMLEEALVTWVHQTIELGGLITGPIIQQKALNLYDKLEAEAQNRDISLRKGKDRKFVASAGWLSRFKKRHGIRKMVIAEGEILSSDTEGALKGEEEEEEEEEEMQEELLQRIKTENEGLEVQQFNFNHDTASRVNSFESISEENEENSMSDDSQRQFAQDKSRTEGEIISVDTRENRNSSSVEKDVVKFESVYVNDGFNLNHSTDFSVSNITSAENAFQCLNALTSWFETQKEIAISEEDVIILRRLKTLIQEHVAPET